VAKTWCGPVSNGQKQEETVTREEGEGGRVRVAAVSVAFIVHALKEARREGRKEGRKKTKKKRRRRTGRSNCRKRKKDSVSSR
jgi:hypothetical protein